jgi:hypothetical protein
MILVLTSMIVYKVVTLHRRLHLNQASEEAPVSAQHINQISEANKLPKTH